ncbi:hypothetical protein DFJ74DRAFT_762828 [Hyaloraphidium curvatum]|nr:hypothetical protein DFJ74DRAFT_762828 [Hyaloraphidium curvatum]
MSPHTLFDDVLPILLNCHSELVILRKSVLRDGLEAAARIQYPGRRAVEQTKATAGALEFPLAGQLELLEFSPSLETGSLAAVEAMLRRDYGSVAVYDQRRSSPGRPAGEAEAEKEMWRRITGGEYSEDE